MSYVQSVLQPGETVLYRSNLHWLIYWRAILVLIVAVALFVVSGAYSGTDAGHAILIAAAIFFLVAVVDGLGAAIRRRTTELAVTEHRIIFKSGLFSRHTIEMNRSKVESVDVDQTVMGRILGYGTILVHGTGGSLEPLQNIADPITLRSRITVG